MRNAAGKPELAIQFFGSFAIETQDGRRLDNDQSRTKQLWLLLEYLIVNRHNDVPSDKLAEILWPGGEIDNPSGALKNLIYRLRNMLTAVGRTPDNEFILSRRGNYAWNNELRCSIDIEDFSELCQKAAQPGVSSDDKTRYYLNAIELYRGDFLNALAYEEWVVPLCTYYRNMFFDSVFKVCELLFETRQFDEADQVCTKAITVDPFDEKVQVTKMRALMGAGKNSQALSHYEYVTALFYRELGVKPSEELVAMYRDIVRQIKSVETDLSVIQGDLREASEAKGAFYCDYEVFKNVYRLQARSLERTGQSVYICLLTLSEMGKHVVNGAVREKAMDELLEALQNSLRRGDIISRYSATQYVLMLPALTMENCDMVVQRVQKNFNRLCRSRAIAVDATVMPVDPVL